MLVSRIVVHVCDGDDQVTVSGGVLLPALIDGGEGNDKLNSGNGLSVLLGGAGNDDINGGSSRDILIGGAAADRIAGNSGDDLIVAGATDSDAVYADLFQFLDEWNRTDIDVALRVTHIQSGGGYNDALFNGATIHDDAAIDKLTGSAGVDWFFANLDAGVKDQITDRITNELVQELV